MYKQTNSRRRAAGPGRVVLFALLLAGFAPPAMASAPDGFHLLSNYGDVSTPEAARATLDALAAKLLAQGGGTIFVTDRATTGLELVNDYQTDRFEPGITLVDLRVGRCRVLPTRIGNPSYKWTGIEVDRTINMEEDGLGFWGQFAAAQIENKIVSGATSFYQTVSEAVEPGENVRVYPDSVEGLTVGARLCNYSAPESKTLFTVKRLEWDAERRRYCLVTDLEHPIPAGGRIGTKNMCAALNVHSWFNADHQTAGVMGLHTRAYGAGDLFNFSNSLIYQSNIMSTLGDEGAVLCELESYGDLDSFRSEVERFDPETGILVYTPGMARAAKLSPSRPIINLNEDKWITDGHVVIVRSATSYKGVQYPVVREGKVPHPGGLIQGSEDAPWDESVVGRYFAVDEDSEKYTLAEMSRRSYRGMKPGAQVRRWYRITDFEKHPDGTKRIRILRVQWYSTSAGSPNLFRQENYSFKDETRPLKYIIAPGAFPCDISRGWVEPVNKASHVPSEPDHPRRLTMAPNGDTGTRFDFEAGDPIVQAVGPDPHYPRMIRMVTSDYFPSILNRDMIQLKNVGRTARIGMNLTSKVKNENQLSRQKDGQPPYLTGINFDSLVGVGIRFERPVTEAAILMEQRDGNSQPIVWRHAGASRRTTLAVTPEDGDMTLTGGGLDLRENTLKNAQIVEARGLSATRAPARNLRGIDVPVAAGATSLDVRFDDREIDGAYAVSVTPNWNAACWVSEKTAQGFTARFGAAAAQDAKVDWIIVR